MIISHRKELIKCRKSFYYFITRYCYSIHVDDYTGEAEVRQFPRYKYVANMAGELQYPKNMHIEKSRQMLMSWILMALFLWELLFVKNSNNFCTSKKQDYVDNGGSESTWRSNFGKIRFMHSHLPTFLKMPLQFKKLIIHNPVNNANVIGESANTDAGRGGTYRRAVMDEAAFIPKSENIFASLKQACKTGLILCSTPYGRDNAFARIKHKVPKGYKKITVHWSQHPDRNQDWYKRVTAGLRKAIIAQELDISYDNSVDGIVYDTFNYVEQVKDIKIDPTLPTWTAWDFGVGDPTSIIFIQLAPVPDGYQIRIVDSYESKSKDAKHYFDIVIGWAQKHGIISFAGHAGDPAGNQRGANLKSWISYLREYGINIQYRYTDYQERILTTDAEIKNLIVARNCEQFLERLSNYKFPTNEQGEVLSNTPEHNFASHMITALEFFMIVRFNKRKSGVSHI